MFAIRTEGQAEKITLVHVFAESLVGIIRKLVRFQVEDGNRLGRVSLLRAVAVVQQRRVAAIGADRDGGGKAVGGGNVSGRWKR